MASAYKRTGRRHYYMEYTDQFGTKKTNVNSKIADRRTAETLANNIEMDAQRIRAGQAPLLPDITGPYLNPTKLPGSWSQFVSEYDERILAGLSERTRPQALKSLDHFTRHVAPSSLNAIGPAMIADFIARRRSDRGTKPGSTVVNATIDHDLRHIKAALTQAYHWGYLPKVPHIKFCRKERHLPRYVTPEHFAAIYAACDEATMPASLPCSPAIWWRALIMFLHLTGLRITQAMCIPTPCLDLTAGTVFLTAHTAKNKRDDLRAIHPLAIEHIQAMGQLGTHVFTWPHHMRTLYVEWHSIQLMTRVPGPEGKPVPLHLPCHRDHTHTPACHLYGFHDLRRAFATHNADRVTADVLQQLMCHQSYTTTQGYIAMAHKLKPALPSLYVPRVDIPQEKPQEKHVG